MAKESVSLRLDNDAVKLLKKIAKEEYGSVSKKGYVVENALQLYEAHRIRPLEASAALSVTEEKIIERLDKRFHDVGKNLVERIGNLYAKEAYEACLSSLLLEDVYMKSGFHKGDYERRRKEAAYRMKTRFDKENADQLGGAIEENEHLKQTLTNVNEKWQKAAQVITHFKEKIPTLEEENERLKKQLEQQKEQQDNLKAWANNLTKYLIDNYSRIKPNRALFDEYIQANPAPKGQ
jgi:hypothetical protein